MDPAPWKAPRRPAPPNSHAPIRQPKRKAAAPVGPAPILWLRLEGGAALTGSTAIRTFLHGCSHCLRTTGLHSRLFIPMIIRARRRAVPAGKLQTGTLPATRPAAGRARVQPPRLPVPHRRRRELGARPLPRGLRHRRDRPATPRLRREHRPHRGPDRRRDGHAVGTVGCERIFPAVRFSPTVTSETYPERRHHGVGRARRALRHGLPARREAQAMAASSSSRSAIWAPPAIRRRMSSPPRSSETPLPITCPRLRKV